MKKKKMKAIAIGVFPFGKPLKKPRKHMPWVANFEGGKSNEYSKKKSCQKKLRGRHIRMYFEAAEGLNATDILTK